MIWKDIKNTKTLKQFIESSIGLNILILFIYKQIVRIKRPLIPFTNTEQKHLGSTSCDSW